MSKYRFVHYWDVWGNADDGFEVNDVATLGNVDLDIQDSDSDKEAIGKVVKTLDKWFDPEKLLRAGLHFEGGLCGGGVFELSILENDVDKPFGRLEEIDVDCPGG